jgi:hypothetical protein
MRPLAVMNIEYLRTIPLLVIVLYGESGQQIDAVIVEFKDEPRLAVKKLSELAAAHEIKTLQAWTTCHSIYAQCLREVGIACEMKSESYTRETRALVDKDAEILLELYDRPQDNEETIEEPKVETTKRGIAAIINKLKTGAKK